MKKVVLSDGKWQEQESGVIAPVLGAVVNPFSGTPSTAPQQWIQIALGLAGGATGMYFWQKRKAEKAQASLTNSAV